MYNEAVYNKGSGKSTIIHCHYRSYEVGLKNEVSVIVSTNFGDDYGNWFQLLFHDSWLESDLHYLNWNCVLEDSTNIFHTFMHYLHCFLFFENYFPQQAYIVCRDVPRQFRLGGGRLGKKWPTILSCTLNPCSWPTFFRFIDIGQQKDIRNNKNNLLWPSWNLVVLPNTR